MLRSKFESIDFFTCLEGGNQTRCAFNTVSQPLGRRTDFVHWDHCPGNQLPRVLNLYRPNWHRIKVKYWAQKGRNSHYPIRLSARSLQRKAVSTAKTVQNGE